MLPRSLVMLCKHNHSSTRRIIKTEKSKKRLRCQLTQMWWIWLLHKLIRLNVWWRFCCQCIFALLWFGFLLLQFLHATKCFLTFPWLVGCLRRRRFCCFLPLGLTKHTCLFLVFTAHSLMLWGLLQLCWWWHSNKFNLFSKKYGNLFCVL